MKPEETGDRLASPWFESLRPICKQACLAAGASHPIDVVLFYLARWCQKRSRAAEPSLKSIPRPELEQAAEKIVRNLTEAGSTVQLLVEGDRGAWNELQAILLASAGSRDAPKAVEFVDEALQKIAMILLTGTPPSQAKGQLRSEVTGPRGEYVFQSPFAFWAKAVVINLIVDEKRRERRERKRAAERGPKGDGPLDRELLWKAYHALPGLLDAIRGLPPVQHSVMVLSLWRRELDPLLLARFQKLAPDLFPPSGQDLVSNDRELAERLGKRAHLVRANRSAARVKLAEQNELWGVLLDVLLPHKSTRPKRSSRRTGGDEALISSGARDA